METKVETMRDLLHQEMDLGPRYDARVSGGHTEAGITGPERFPGVPCPRLRCGGTMRLLWGASGPGTGSGRPTRALECDRCRLHVALHRTQGPHNGQGDSNRWLPAPHHKRRRRDGAGDRHSLSGDAAHRLLQSFHLAAIQAEGGAHPADEAEVLARIPAALRLLRSLAMIELGQWPRGKRDVLCPRCRGKSEPLEPCRLCLGFRYVPERLARWYERQMAGLIGASEESSATVRYQGDLAVFGDATLQRREEVPA